LRWHGHVPCTSTKQEHARGHKPTITSTTVNVSEAENNTANSKVAADTINTKECERKSEQKEIAEQEIL
jgi:hypothetical protein